MHHKDLASFIASLDMDSPLLTKCSDQEIQAFLSGLLFKNGGLAHTDYGMIQDRLSDKEFFDLMAILGIDKPTFLARRDTWCEAIGRGCKPKSSSLCNSAYCGIDDKQSKY